MHGLGAPTPALQIRASPATGSGAIMMEIMMESRHPRAQPPARAAARSLPQRARCAFRRLDTTTPRPRGGRRTSSRACASGWGIWALLQQSTSVRRGPLRPPRPTSERRADLTERLFAMHAVTCAVTEVNGSGYYSGSTAIWDPATDGSVTVTHEAHKKVGTPPSLPPTSARTRRGFAGDVCQGAVGAPCRPRRR